MRLSSDNPDAKFERTKERKQIVMSPKGSNSGRKNSSLLAQVWNWNHHDRLGEVEFGCRFAGDLLINLPTD